ncbi:MAG: hypothetical protein K1X72_13800 [Pyrinomonadaceae bacterium]|nr:hypothetical protein [Pyrinomonadaceae bacterium]
MNFAALALSIYQVLSPFVSKGIDKIVEKAAEEGWTERQAIWEKVKGLFVEDDLTLLNLFKDAETDNEKKGELKGELKSYLKSNPEIAKELEELVKKVEAIEKKNSSTITNEDIRGNSEIENTVEQTTGSATDNKSTIENRNVESSKIKNSVIQK